MNLNMNVLDLSGNCIDKISLKEEIFGKEFNIKLLKQVVEMQENNRRSATAHVKNRALLSYSNKKRRPQKKSGRSRMGRSGSPHHRGGGVCGGPNARVYECSINKKQMAGAVCVILSEKLRQNNLVIIENTDFSEIKTKNFLEFIGKINVSEGAVFIDKEKKGNFFLSMRNVFNFDLLLSRGINPLSILKRKKLVLTLDAIKELEVRYG
jgi:large subunit ribosomal protein L4